MITILAHYDRISLFHTMTPFFLKQKERKIFHITQSAAWCLKHDKNKILFMERQFQHRQPRDMEEGEINLLKKLRDKYKKIIFFCGQPEAGTNRLDILPYVDRIFHKSVFSNPADYKKNLYGKNLFADYYHKNFGIADNPEYICGGGKPPDLSWNIGVGTYPRSHLPQRIGTVFARANMPLLGRRTGGNSRKSFRVNNNRAIAVHARIDPVTCPSIAYQRILFLERIASFDRDKRSLFLTGLVGQKRYYRELENSKMVLSPFGWGEVCFRDFEAILAGALLLKPDMSHLATWPNVYVPYETYIPLKWDGSDILEKAERYLGDEKERNRIAAGALKRYISELSGLQARFDNLLGEYYQ
jgi:hypothetical protein